MIQVSLSRSSENRIAPQRRTQAERRQESGRRLIEAAIELIATEGVAAATFDAIGSRAGYSRGLVTQKFGSKQGLIDAVVDHLHERLAEIVEAAGIEQLSGLEGLLAYVDIQLLALGDGLEAQAYFILLAGTISELSPMRQSFAASHHRVEVLIEGLIRRGQSEGDIPVELDAQSAALTIGSLLLGVSIQRLVDPTTMIAPLKRLILQSLRENRLLSSRAQALRS